MEAITTRQIVLVRSKHTGRIFDVRAISEWTLFQCPLNDISSPPITQSLTHQKHSVLWPLRYKSYNCYSKRLVYLLPTSPIYLCSLTTEVVSANLTLLRRVPNFGDKFLNFLHKLYINFSNGLLALTTSTTQASEWDGYAEKVKPILFYIAISSLTAIPPNTKQQHYLLVNRMVLVGITYDRFRLGWLSHQHAEHCYVRKNDIEKANINSQVGTINEILHAIVMTC